MTNKAQNTQVIEKILQDPLLIQRLSDQVYQLLLQDLIIQRDRLPKL
ncbi:MAG: hypothetical protein LH660_00795 [Phormidesmis sp. CAN_BIN36]|nr:hypothetical protein [Phormidesmis sp. CAN_BIN36]